MSRILITGATGLIGRHAVAELAAAGHDVHALVHRRDVPEELRTAAVWHAADLLDPSAVCIALQAARPEALLHLAWPTTSAGTNSDVHGRFLEAGKALIRDFYANGGQRVVVAGTCFEYDWSNGICVEGETPLRPNTVYGACKNALREFLADHALTMGRSWAWGRIFFVYGPHQDRTRFVPAVIEGLLQNQPVLCTQGLQIRDYLHARDVAGGLIRLFESGVVGECNIGSGERVTLRDIALEIAALLGNEHLLKFGAKAMPPDEPPVILADITRLREKVRWQPRMTLARGVADVVETSRRAETATAVA